MEITLNRYGRGKNKDDIATLGKLDVDGISVFTLEDDYDEKKEFGHTRIPQGTYEIKLKKHGGFHKRYSERFKDIHKGMLHLQNVPNYDDILIHCGNTHEDTKGCILTGLKPYGNNAIAYSVKAYVKIYPYIASKLEEGEKVFIKIID